MWKGTLEVTEKVDGSQFAFGLSSDGELVMRSKGVVLHPPVDGMFATAVAQVQAREDKIRALLPNGTFVYGEYLNKPKHNTLAYERVPEGNIAVFGIMTEDEGEEHWSPYKQVETFAKSLGFDVVPLLGTFEVGQDVRKEATHALKLLLESESFLGKEKIEGIVVKNYEQRVHMNGRVTPVFSKYVSADFKERHGAGWTGEKDKLGDFLTNFEGDKARWIKAIHRLRDEGKSTDSVKDIGTLVRMVQDDLMEEEAPLIKEFLFNHFSRQIKQMSTRGFPEWFKDRLLEESTHTVDDERELSIA
jgi:hypothetical protein